MSEFAHNPNRYLAFITEPLPRILHILEIRLVYLKACTDYTNFVFHG